MAYRIEYAPSEKVIKERQLTRKRWIAIAAIVCLTAGIFHVTGIGDMLRDFLIPGDSEVTGAAWDHMVDALRNGSSLRQAVEAFCGQVLEGAGIER